MLRHQTLTYRFMIDVYQMIYHLPRNLISLHLAETPGGLLLDLPRQKLLFCHPTAASMAPLLVCGYPQLPMALQ